MSSTTNSFTADINLLKTKINTILGGLSTTTSQFPPASPASLIKIISDFDATLSLPGWSSWCVFERRHDLSDNYRHNITELVKKYYPIEIDQNMNVEAKSNAMLEWRAAAVRFLREEQVSYRAYNTILRDTPNFIRLKPGVPSLLRLTHAKQIPVIVLSAGLFDVIDASLADAVPDVYSMENEHKQLLFVKNDQNPLQQQHQQRQQPPLSTPTSMVDTHHSTHPNPINNSTRTIHVIANHIKLGPNEQTNGSSGEVIITGMKSGEAYPCIHVFNKNEQLVHSKPYYKSQIEHRTSSIVIGDSLGDSTMVSNPLSDHNVLRVGFLTQSPSRGKTVDTHLQKYLDVFDIVFVDNHRGIDWVRNLIQCAADEPVDAHALGELDAKIQTILSGVHVGVPPPTVIPEGH